MTETVVNFFLCRSKQTVWVAQLLGFHVHLFNVETLQREYSIELLITKFRAAELILTYVLFEGSQTNRQTNNLVFFSCYFC